MHSRVGVLKRKNRDVPRIAIITLSSLPDEGTLFLTLTNKMNILETLYELFW